MHRACRLLRSRTRSLDWRSPGATPCGGCSPTRRSASGGACSIRTFAAAASSRPSRSWPPCARTEVCENFEELAIPFAVVATDFWECRSVVLDSGPLKPAVQASMALPGLFTPVELDGRVLIDGGTMNPVPYDLLIGLVRYRDRHRHQQRQPGRTGIGPRILQQSFRLDPDHAAGDRPAGAQGTASGHLHQTRVERLQNPALLQGGQDLPGGAKRPRNN